MALQVYSKAEEDIIRSCINKDLKSQEVLYRKYAPVLYTICLRYLKDENIAADLLAESFVRIFDKLSQFRFEGSFEGWLKRIVVNDCLTYLRKHQSLMLRVSLGDAPEASLQAVDPDRLSEKDILNVIKALPEGYRTVFNLYAIDGYSHKEISEKLGISEGTSKSQLSRARALLQEALSEYQDSHQKNIRS